MSRRIFKLLLVLTLITAVLTLPVNALAADSANNGGMLVEYKGIFYYREYNASSFEEEALFGNYGNIPETEKTMMSITEGEKKALFTDNGKGPIYIINDMMFLTRLKEDYTPEIYSVDLSGNNETNFGYGNIVAADEENGVVLCTRLNDGNLELITITSEGTINKLTNIQKFIAFEDNYVYYTVSIDDYNNWDDYIRLAKINIDGSDNVTLAEVKMNVAEEFSYNGLPDVECFQIAGNTVYFSVGGYAGTGNFYQGGKIAKVNKDGTGYRILAGSDNTADRDFYIMRTSTEYQLYYNDFSGDITYCLSLKDMTLTESTFKVHPLGVPFYENGEYKVYPDDRGSAVSLVTEADYKDAGLDGTFMDYDDVYIDAIDIQPADGWVYYKLEAGKHNPDNDIGWRYSYIRTGSHVYRKELSTGERELLFEY